MKIGVLLNNIGPNQLAFNVLWQGSRFTSSGQNDMVVFYERQALPVLSPSIATMQIAEAWGFPGILISTDISTTIKLAKCPAAEQKLFYIWDMEWLRWFSQYEILSSIYRNPSYDLIVRTQSHKEAIETAWNRPVLGVVDDFNLEELLALLDK